MMARLDVAEAGAVSFRLRDGSQHNGIPVDRAVELIARHVASRANHDTVEGVTELYESGRYATGSLRIIPGVGFSTGDGAHEAHILGYNIDIYNAGLQEKLEEISEARWTRFTEIVERLRELGYEIEKRGFDWIKEELAQ